MRKVPARAGLALAACAVLAGAATALAGPEPRPATAPIPPETARLAEIQTELAWFTDPMTFPCPLAARVSGGKLIVAGLAPNERTREQALRLARQACDLPVESKIKVQALPACPDVPVSRDGMCQACVAELQKSFSRFFASFRISAQDEGHILIEGKVASYEDKLAVSRRLARLAGCKAIHNEVQIEKIVADGKTYEMVAADGKLKVPEQPVQPKTGSWLSASTMAAAPGPLVVPAAPSGPPLKSPAGHFRSETERLPAGSPPVARPAGTMPGKAPMVEMARASSPPGYLPPSRPMAQAASPAPATQRSSPGQAPRMLPGSTQAPLRGDLQPPRQVVQPGNAPSAAVYQLPANPSTARRSAQPLPPQVASAQLPTLPPAASAGTAGSKPVQGPAPQGVAPAAAITRVSYLPPESDGAPSSPSPARPATAVGVPYQPSTYSAPPQSNTVAYPWSGYAPAQQPAPTSTVVRTEYKVKPVPSGKSYPAAPSPQPAYFPAEAPAKQGPFQKLMNRLKPSTAPANRSSYVHPMPAAKQNSYKPAHTTPPANHYQPMTSGGVPPSPRLVPSAIQQNVQPVPVAPPAQPIVPPSAPIGTDDDGPALPPMSSGKRQGTSVAWQAGPIQQVAAVSTMPAAQLAPAASFAAPAVPATPAKANLPEPILSLLRQRIEQACAGQARVVQVTAISKHELAVCLKVSRKYDRERVGNRVLQIPELRPYAVQLEVDEGF